MKKYTLKYKIPQTRYQRPSTQTLTNLSKDNVNDWTKWLDHKQAIYIVINN